MLNFLKKELNEFKAFAMRGNVIDMAVGIIIGAAFGKIVDSMVNDVIMPPLGWLMGKVDFTNLYFTLPVDGDFTKYPSLEAAKAAGAVTINYGVFIGSQQAFFHHFPCKAHCNMILEIILIHKLHLRICG